MSGLSAKHNFFYISLHPEAHPGGGGEGLLRIILAPLLIDDLSSYYFLDRLSYLFMKATQNHTI